MNKNGKICVYVVNDEALFLHVRWLLHYLILKKRILILNNFWQLLGYISISK